MNYRSVKGVVWNLVDNLEAQRDELAARLEAVRARAVEIRTAPLAMVAVCKLCGQRTESLSLNEMDPEPGHDKSCPLTVRDEP